jgi:hypothetical protein
MAIQSRVQWDNGRPDRPATVTIFWDDVSLLLTSVVVNNTNGIYPLMCAAVVDAQPNRNFNVTVQPGSTFQQNVPTNQANRFELFMDPIHGVTGISWNIGGG